MPIQRPKTETSAGVPKGTTTFAVVAKSIGDYAANKVTAGFNTGIPPVQSLDIPEELLEATLMDFIAYFLRLIPKPSQTQVVGLATALGCDPKDMQATFCAILGEAADDEMKNALRDSDLKGAPGINKPGDLDSFDYEKINPYGRTSLDAIESPMSNLGLDLKESLRVPDAPVVPGATYPAIQPNLIPPAPSYPTVPANPPMLPPSYPTVPPHPGIIRPPTVTYPAIQPNPVMLSETSLPTPNLLASKSKAASAPFLMGMEDAELLGSDNNFSYDSISQPRVLADAAPTNKQTGIDDGSTVDEDADDQEQQALIDDGDIDDESLVNEVNNNRYLVDDGLTEAINQ